MKTKTSWDLSLLYKNDKDPQIEKDLKDIEKSALDFEKKYKGKDFTGTAEKLLIALKDYDKLVIDFKGHKPWWYFALRNKLDSNDSVAGALSTKNRQRLTSAFNKVNFFDLEISKIAIKTQKQYLKDSKLKEYKYALEVIFKRAKYNLSEKEEQLLNLLSETSYNMWVNGQSRVLSNKTVKYKNKELPIAEAVSILSELSKSERSKLHKKLNEIYKTQGSFADSEINAIYNYKKTVDELRGFKKPYSGTILSYENEEKTIENLVELVTKNFKISQKFYTLHSKLLKESKLTVADRSVKIGEIKKKFDFETSIGILKNTFNKVDPQYTKILEEFLQNGQIDVYPKKGKDGGAFCWGLDNLPTFVLLNHTNDIRSVETFAHEMGHAFHTELSKNLPPRYIDYTMSAAEVASTFFEQIVTSEIEKDLSDNEKIILLHNKIMGDIATIFRQIACFNFELELHNQIREKGQVPKGDIANLLVKHLKSYMGKSVEVTHDDGYFFVYWSHIRRFFYVYSYAYGQLISRSMFEKWQQDPSFAKNIEKFLKAGGSMSPEDIFKSIGIDTSKPEFFEAGLKSIEKDINKLEKLAKKTKRI